MTGEEYIAVGKLGKPHSLSGAFRFKLLLQLKSQKKFPKSLFMFENGAYRPWFIAKVDLNEEGGIILFEEINSPEKAKNYTNKELYIKAKDAKTWFTEGGDDLPDLNGYIALHNGDEVIGVIKETVNTGGQLLLLVEDNGKDVMIPFVEDFIVEISKKKREVIFDLPEGLLDL
ncbi:MAG TPA: ribosome maturation factor RimM [Chitinophagales bacterium]|nr:ribosome maturation factor RimM [Chitinophagales bacterium]